jgi:hypothetical protein
MNNLASSDRKLLSVPAGITDTTLSPSRNVDARPLKLLRRIISQTDHVSSYDRDGKNLSIKEATSPPIVKRNSIIENEVMKVDSNHSFSININDEESEVDEEPLKVENSQEHFFDWFRNA